MAARSAARGPRSFDGLADIAADAIIFANERLFERSKV